ncbi:MAG TPA: peptide ABC transporter permease, partial [Syntrophomonas sp.]|nr:peptide ABC transporter permease [Syntrophomonas sp.]
MFRYVLKRIGTSLFTLWVIITITFILMHSIPGDPLTRDKKMPEAIRQNIEAQYHLNEPLWKQYGYYFQGLAHGELGPSLKYEGVTVNEIIGQGFPVSAQLGLAALVLMLLVGLPAGVISALRQNQWQDHTAMFMATLGVAVPNFVLAT